MFNMSLVTSLSQVQPPILSLYIDVNPAEQKNRGVSPGYLKWLKAEARTLSNTISARERGAFQVQLDRVEEFLRGEPLGPQGYLIFAGPNTWLHLPLHIEVKSEVAWGRPHLSQLLNVLSKQKTCYVVTVDRAGARFFWYEFGELTDLGEKGFHIDISQWKRKEHAHMAPRHTRMPHGPQADVFQKRVEAQYVHLCRTVADRLVDLCAKERGASIILVGSDRLTSQIEKALPTSLQIGTLLVKQDLARIDVAKLPRHLTPKVAAWAEQLEDKRVDQLLDGDQRSVIGIDETLAQLQEGRVGTVVLPAGLDTSLRQCAVCGLVSRSADRDCPSCGSKRRTIMLREALTDLILTHRADIEIVNGKAGKKLVESGGIGGWLRQPKHASA